MKTISMMTGFVLLTTVSMAQYSNVNVTFRGNTNYQVAIDGNLYSSANYSTTNNNGNRVLNITDLAAGRHTLQVMNANNRSVGSRTTFNLRQGYNMHITVNNRGGISLTERRGTNSTTGNYRTAISSSNFNNIVAQVRAKRGQSSKFSTANSLVTTGSNYFSALQLSQLMAELNGESYRLQLAKNAYAYLVDPTNINTIYNRLNSTASRNELQNYINTYNSTNGGVYNGGGNTNTNVGVAITDATFNQLVSNVRDKWLPGAKMSELTNIFANTSYYYTSSQAKQLISLVSDESNRLQLAKASYRSIVDPANFSTIYDLLSSTTSRNELDLYVRNNGGTSVYNNGTYNNGTYNNGTYNNGYRVAMVDADYNALMEDVRGRWLPGAKMSALTNIVNTTTYNFSSAQARGLIALVSDEANRLQLAKSVFPRLVDPNSYTVMYDLFGTQASRDQLDAYVRSYR